MDNKNVKPKSGIFKNIVAGVALILGSLILIGIIYSFDDARKEKKDDTQIIHQSASPSQSKESNTIKTETPTKTAIPLDAKTIDKFQGEWEGEYENVIISGPDVNFIHYDIADETLVSNIHTFHFEHDENGKLIVCNPSSQPRYVLSITKKGQLICKSIDEDEEKKIYNYKSDNTELPEIKLDPKIGMTKDEVLNSTWGYPQKKNTTETLKGTREQWVYEKGYIYLFNGIVTSIQKR